MPNTKSAIRRVRRVKKQTQVNRIRKSKYKTAVKQMEIHLKGKEKEKAKNISRNSNQLMQVAKSGVISKNTAARKISRISKEFLQNNQFEVDSFLNLNLYLESSNKMLKLKFMSCNFFLILSER